MSKHPNFILFITDQHRADFLGCYGHPVLRTPHIDSVAAKGTMFALFYVASPVCMPNRTSLMTGRMPSVHGVRSNGIPLSMNAVTFVDLLRDAGYHTALIGKSHLQNFTSWPPIVKRRPAREGYREPSGDLVQALRNDLSHRAYEQETPEYWNVKDARIQTPFYGFDHISLVRAHGDEAGGDYDRWLAERAPKAKALLGPKNSLAHDYTVSQAYRTAIPEELYPTAFIGDRAQAYLQAADAVTGTWCGWRKGVEFASANLLRADFLRRPRTLVEHREALPIFPGELGAHGSCRPATTHSRSPFREYLTAPPAQLIEPRRLSRVRRSEP